MMEWSTNTRVHGGTVRMIRYRGAVVVVVVGAAGDAGTYGQKKMEFKYDVYTGIYSALKKLQSSYMEGGGRERSYSREALLFIAEIISRMLF